MRHALFLLALVAAAPAARGEHAVDLPAPVQAALDGAVAIGGARVVPVSYTPSSGRDCVAESASLNRPIDGSGRFAVKLTGSGCTGWAWLKVDVWAQVPVTTRTVRTGERLDDAVTFVDRPITAGRAPATMFAGAVATRPLARGQAVMPEHLQGPGGNSGDSVKVLVQSGALAVETTGRIVSCGRGKACAVLSSGKHVEGRLDEGRLVVEVP